MERACLENQRKRGLDLDIAHAEEHGYEHWDSEEPARRPREDDDTSDDSQPYLESSCSEDSDTDATDSGSEDAEIAPPHFAGRDRTRPLLKTLEREKRTDEAEDILKGNPWLRKLALDLNETEEVRLKEAENDCGESSG